MRKTVADTLAGEVVRITLEPSGVAVSGRYPVGFPPESVTVDPWLTAVGRPPVVIAAGSGRVAFLDSSRPGEEGVSIEVDGVREVATLWDQ